MHHANIDPLATIIGPSSIRILPRPISLLGLNGLGLREASAQRRFWLLASASASGQVPLPTRLPCEPEPVNLQKRVSLVWSSYASQCSQPLNAWLSYTTSPVPFRPAFRKMQGKGTARCRYRFIPIQSCPLLQVTVPVSKSLSSRGSCSLRYRLRLSSYPNPPTSNFERINTTHPCHRAHELPVPIPTIHRLLSTFELSSTEARKLL